MRWPRPSVTDTDASAIADDMALENFDQHAADYEHAVNRSISFTGRNVSFFAERKVDLLRRLLHANGRDLSRTTVLDVGCGTGTTDQFLIDQVRSLNGVDISQDMLAVARRNVPEANFECYDGNTLPFTAGSFDVVIAICVLHHVPAGDQLLFAQELHRVTCAGGLVVIFEHNPANPLTRRAVSGCELDRGVVLLTPGDVERLLAGAKCTIIGHEYFLVTPFGGRFGTALDRPFRRVPLGGQYAVAAEAVS